MSIVEDERNYDFFHKLKNEVLNGNPENIENIYIDYFNNVFKNKTLLKTDSNRFLIKNIGKLHQNNKKYQLYQTEVVECLIIRNKNISSEKNLISIYILLFYLFPDSTLLKKMFCNYISSICNENQNNKIIDSWIKLEYLEQAILVSNENDFISDIFVQQTYYAIINLVKYNLEFDISKMLNYRLESDSNLEVKKVLNNLFQYTNDIKESFRNSHIIKTKSKITLSTNYENCFDLIIRCLSLVKKYKSFPINDFKRLKNEFELKLGYSNYSRLIEEEKIYTTEDLINFRILKILEKTIL
jgi:hypothetical protein